MNTKSDISTFSLALVLFSAPAPSLSQNFWQQTALDSGLVARLATNERGDIFAGVWSSVDHTGQRLYRSTNNGDSWDTLNVGIPDPRVRCILTLAYGGIFVGITFGTDTIKSGVYYSHDNGGTWQKQSSLWQVLGLITPDSGRSFLAGVNRYFTGGVYRSFDSCRTWMRLTPDNSDCYDIGQLVITRQGSILAAPTENNYGPHGLFRSIDDGKTWGRHRTWSAPGGWVQDFLIPARGDYFLVANDGVNQSYYSSDGQSWASANTGIPPWAADYMQTIAMDSSGALYVGERFWGPGNGGGVFTSTNNGSSWVPWSSGLPNIGVYSLVVNSHGYVFAGGSRSGVFRSVNTVTGVQQSQWPLPKTFSLSQNYPNPFNPRTRIVYGVKSREFIELRVFDVLAREVAVLVNEVKEAGEYTVEWNAGTMSSGVYYYRLRAGQFVSTRKLLLMK